LRMFLTLLMWLAIGYGAVVALMALFQSRLVYFPDMAREIVTTPQSVGLPHEAVEVHTEDGETLQGWWVPAVGAGAMPKGSVLFFHGNAGNISHRLEYLRMFHELGYSVLAIDYRGYGRSTGSPSEAGTYQDALAAWRWVAQARSVRPQDIILAGESLGGAVASWLAAQHTPRALLLFSTFTSVPELGAELYPLLPVRLIARISYDSVVNLRHLKAPVLVAHSPHDEIVPYRHGRALFEAASQPPACLELSGGHNQGFVHAREDWVKAVAAFLERSAAAL
jgi:fermentation-respiration switch protein FrsA (DUF1100 family)